MRRHGAILFVALAVTAGVRTGQAQDRPVPDMTVVVHPGVAVESLDRSSLAAIFSMSRRSWEGGVTVVPFNLPPESPVRQAFDLLVLGLQPAEVSRYWIDQRIRGQGHPPRQVGDPALILRLVANVKGSIGYIPAGMEDKTVRVVARIIKGKIVGP